MIALYATRLTLPNEPAKRKTAASQGAHRLLAYGLETLGYNPQKLTLCRTSEGKPYIQGGPIHFSLSHSESWAVCALSHLPVGVDIERIRPVSVGVWKRFLAQFPHEPCGDSYEATLRWTRYEAALKLRGYPALQLPETQFTTYSGIPGFLLTVCCEEGAPKPHFIASQTLDRDDLILP